MRSWDESWFWKLLSAIAQVLRLQTFFFGFTLTKPTKLFLRCYLEDTQRRLKNIFHSEKTRFSPAITFHVESGEDKILLSHKFAFIWQTNYRCTLYGDAVNLWRLCCVVREWDTREWIYDSFRMTSQLVELIVYWRSLALPSQRKKHAVRNWRRR